MQGACNNSHNLSQPFSQLTTLIVYNRSEGITNQRMALISYSALAAELNRTLVVDFLKTGNKVMEGVRKLDIGFVFDLDQLQRRLPSGLR